MVFSPHQANLFAFSCVKNIYKSEPPNEEVMNLLWQMSSKDEKILLIIRFMFYLALSKNNPNKIGFCLYGSDQHQRTALIQLLQNMVYGDNAVVSANKWKKESSRNSRIGTSLLILTDFEFTTYTSALIQNVKDRIQEDEIEIFQKGVGDIILKNKNVFICTSEVKASSDSWWNSHVLSIPFYKLDAFNKKSEENKEFLKKHSSTIFNWAMALSSEEVNCIAKNVESLNLYFQKIYDPSKCALNVIDWFVKNVYYKADSKVLGSYTFEPKPNSLYYSYINYAKFNSYSYLLPTEFKKEVDDLMIILNNSQKRTIFDKKYSAGIFVKNVTLDLSEKDTYSFRFPYQEKIKEFEQINLSTFLTKENKNSNFVWEKNFNF